HLGILAKSATRASRSSLLPMVLATGNREALARLLAPTFEFDNSGEETKPSVRWTWFGEFLDEIAVRQISLDSLKTTAPADGLTRLLSQTERLFNEASVRLDDATAP